jgi:hypothetical protein
MILEMEIELILKNQADGRSTADFFRVLLLVSEEQSMKIEQKWEVLRAKVEDNKLGRGGSVIDLNLFHEFERIIWLSRTN